jgi:hypothetical protein
MIEWVRKHLPRIIILENVKTAPYAYVSILAPRCHIEVQYPD